MRRQYSMPPRTARPASGSLPPPEDCLAPFLAGQPVCSSSQESKPCGWRSLLSGNLPRLRLSLVQPTINGVATQKFYACPFGRFGRWPLTGQGSSRPSDLSRKHRDSPHRSSHCCCVRSLPISRSSIRVGCYRAAADLHCVHTPQAGVGWLGGFHSYVAMIPRDSFFDALNELPQGLRSKLGAPVSDLTFMIDSLSLPLESKSTWRKRIERRNVSFVSSLLRRVRIGLDKDLCPRPL